VCITCRKLFRHLAPKVASCVPWLKDSDAKWAFVEIITVLERTAKSLLFSLLGISQFGFSQELIDTFL
jgi:hypothetical protein